RAGRGRGGRCGRCGSSCPTTSNLSNVSKVSSSSPSRGRCRRSSRGPRSMATKGEEESPSFLAALGSLFGSGPKIVRPAFSVYGKLPIYKDFLRHGLASQEAQAFRQWLDRGFSRYWDAEAACRDYVIGPHLFCLRFEGLGRRLVGGLWGSHDQGELRRFPFALFVSVPAGGAFGDLAVLGILGQVAEKARDLRHALGRASDVQGFYQIVREASLTLR